MKQAVFGVAAVVWLLAVVSDQGSLEAYEDYSYEEYQVLGFPCGIVQTTNESAQAGQFNWLQYTVGTTGALDICGQWFVTTSATVVGVPHSSVSKTGLLYATVQVQVPVPHYNTTYVTNGTHVSTTSIPLLRVTQRSQSEAYVREPEASGNDSDGICEGGIDCLAMGANGPGTASPIIIDTAGNGYALSSVEDGVWFDLDADGTPELVAWTRPDSDDAFLALDRNGNGRIDDGSELFGNHTPVFAAGPVATAANGFEALKFLEWAGYGLSTSPAHVNETLDAHDAAFGRLLLWRDLNHNGISEPDELTPVTAAGIMAIFTDYKEVSRRDRFGNQFRQMGRIQWANGRTSLAYDVWLQKR